jgi:hypothetical protein
MAIRHPALYKAARVAARSRAVERLPMLTILQGTMVYRNVDVGLGDMTVGEGLARTIYKSELNEKNRWTGKTVAADPDGQPGVGGLYVTLDLDALIAEMWHYTLDRTVEADMRARARQKSAGSATPGAKSAPGRPGTSSRAPLTPADLGNKLPTRRIFCYEIQRDVAVGDVAIGSPRGAAFLDDVWSADVVQDAAARTPYRAMRGAHDSSSDHSFARGVCQGVYDARPDLAAIRVTSVRIEAATTLGTSGYSLVFLGRDNTRIELLRADRQISFVTRPGGGAEDVSKWFPRPGSRTP